VSEANLSFAAFVTIAIFCIGLIFYVKRLQERANEWYALFRHSEIRVGNLIERVKDVEFKKDEVIEEMQAHVRVAKEQVKELIASLRMEISALSMDRAMLVDQIDDLHGGKRIAKRLRKEYGIEAVKKQVPDEPMLNTEWLKEGVEDQP
jgi:cell division protein FtsB